MRENEIQCASGGTGVKTTSWVQKPGGGVAKVVGVYGRLLLFASVFLVKWEVRTLSETENGEEVMEV